MFGAAPGCLRFIAPPNIADLPTPLAKEIKFNSNLFFYLSFIFLLVEELEDKLSSLDVELQTRKQKISSIDLQFKQKEVRTTYVLSFEEKKTLGN